MTPAVKRSLYVGLTCLLVVLRFVHLDADPPSWLSWSSGIYSDEGIYACDARSVVLFGHWAPGDFHSAEIAPLHHLLLLCVFRLFGVSLITVRSLSVVTSLVTLVFFFLVLRKQFDEKTAVLGFIFLGLSPVYLFYNRLGLLETPTVCLLVIALYLSTFPKGQWLTGIFLALAVIYKPLAILCIPAFFVDCRENPRHVAIRLASLLTGLLTYFVTWQLPHRANLSRLNRYYLLHQYLPHTVGGLGHNLVRSLWSGSSDGILPYLLHFAPPLLLAVVVAAFQGTTRNDKRLTVYWCWLMLPAATLCLISYEPSRYFLLFWPALAAISAVALTQASSIFRQVYFAIFAITFLMVTVTSLGHPKYLIANAGKEVGILGPIAGQYAPELGLSNKSVCLYVQPGIANDTTPVASYTILITRSTYWNKYWKKRSNIRPGQVTGSALLLPKIQTIDEVLAYTSKH
jgi:4-amino-4-deoxy-L-arabinose transferase-like glycosyltransferase